MTVNNIIILLVSICTLILYARKKYVSTFCLLGISYVCLPVIKMSSGKGINSAYVLTLVCMLIFINSLIKKRLSYDKIAIYYLVSMIAGLTVMGIGLLLNGNPKVSDLIHFTGMGQYIVTTFMLTILIKSYGIDKRILFRRIIVGVLVLNYCVGLIQLFSWNVGEKITRQLYVYSGKEAPLNTTRDELGRFARIFGTSFTPTTLGIVSLLMLTYILHEMIQEEKVTKSNLILYMASLGLGLLAFSKSTIIGVFLIWALSFFMALIQKRCKQVLVLFLKFLGMIVGTFVIIGSFQCLIGLGPQVDYYYFKASNITVALGSRYDNLGSSLKAEDISIGREEQEEFNGSQEVEEHTGNLRDTFEIFMEHPFVGVGPSQIKNEFIGDSEYISILHNGGVFTFIIYAIFYGGLLIYYFIQRKTQELFMLLVIGFGGVSMNVFSYGCIIPFLAFCICRYKDVNS